MEKSGGKVTFILAVIAAVLAFTAALIEYLRYGSIDFRPIAGGLFILAVGWGAWTRRSVK